MASGLDAVSHAFESVWNKNANPITLALATCSLRHSLAALPRLYTNGNDEAARSDMMQASLLAGLAISHTRTALAHSISYPLTARYGVAHGIACSFTLPALIRFNGQHPQSHLHALARALEAASPDQLATRVEALLHGVDALRWFEETPLSNADREQLLGEMFTPERAGNNERVVDGADIRHLVDQAWPIKN